MPELVRQHHFPVCVSVFDDGTIHYRVEPETLVGSHDGPLWDALIGEWRGLAEGDESRDDASFFDALTKAVSVLK